MSRRVLNFVLVSTVAGSECSSAAKPLNSKCEGCPPMYNGKLCASTTRYNDQTKGPCGCGAADPPPADQWTFTAYTAALNAANLEPENPSVAWCPTGCGSCYRVCSTGGQVQGKDTTADVCRVFKISNRCGDGYDSNTPDWCSQRKSWQECAADSNACAAESSTNKFGYAAHFDLMDMHGQITTGLQWDNPEVTFEPVPCTEWEGPSWDCSCSSSEGNSTTVAPVDPTTQEPTSAPMDPTTVAPVDPTTQEPTIVPVDPTTQEPTPPEDGAYCPSVQDLVVAYGDGVELKDQGWTVNGGGGAATKAAYNLNGGYVEYDIDVSNAKAGTIPNVYSIAPSGLGADGFVKDKDYCDGADQHEYPWCVEVDWIESNGVCGGATTVHTLPGTGSGTCNAWGCRTEYHNDAPKIHMRIDYDDAGHMTVSRDGTPIDAMDPAPQPSDFDVIKKMHDSTGAVIYSSMWTGSWVPGPEDCGAGPGELTGSSFTVSNLKIHGSVVQGPEPQRCTTDEPTTVAPVDPTTQEPTTAPVDPTTPEPTTAPMDPTTDDSTTFAPEETTTIVPEPTTDEPTTIAPLDPTTQEPTIAPLDPTTVAPVDPTMPPEDDEDPTPEPTTIAPTTQPITEQESSTTSALVTTTQPPAPTPSPQSCRACVTFCAPCQECTEGKDGSFAFGSCEKCWQCWDWDDDELEDDDDDMDADCDAMHKDHDWDDDEVRCLTNDHQDCRACWAAGLLGEMQVLV